MADYTIRTLTREEIDTAVEWAAREGWNPGLYDAGCFHAADKDGFLGGFLDGELVATISVVSYGKAFGFLGFYIVAPERRGKGYGYKIWEAGVAKLKGINTGLDGVVEQQHNYKKSGFELAYRNIRYEGTGGETAPIDKRIVEVKDVPFEKILAYDRECFGFDREAFLRCWLNQEKAVTLALQEDDRITGYTMLRKCREGWKTGPLFADTPQGAEALFDTLRSKVGSYEKIYLDTPEVNSAAVGLAESRGMQVVFETARMYDMNDPGLPTHKIFGVTTFELG